MNLGERGLAGRKKKGKVRKKSWEKKGSIHAASKPVFLKKEMRNSMFEAISKRLQELKKGGRDP